MVHLSRVNLQYLNSCILVRKWKLYFPVQPSRSHESRVKYIRSVGGTDNFDIIIWRKSS